MKTLLKNNAFQIIVATTALLILFVGIVWFAYSVVGLNDMI